MKKGVFSIEPRAGMRLPGFEPGSWAWKAQVLGHYTTAACF
jgi:hypothetical protein